MINKPSPIEEFERQAPGLFARLVKFSESLELDSEHALETALGQTRPENAPAASLKEASALLKELEMLRRGLGQPNGDGFAAHVVGQAFEVAKLRMNTSHFQDALVLAQARAAQDRLGGHSAEPPQMSELDKSRARSRARASSNKILTLVPPRDSNRDPYRELDAHEAAAVLDLSYHTLNTRRSQGRNDPPWHRYASRVFYIEHEILHWKSNEKSKKASDKNDCDN